jgi:hypothetical protein
MKCTGQYRIASTGAGNNVNLIVVQYVGYVSVLEMSAAT